MKTQSNNALYRLLEVPWLYNAAQKTLAAGAEKNLTRDIRELLARLPRAERLLDVGCGPSSWLWRVNLKPVGLDLSPSYCAAFAQNGNRAVTASAAALPFRDESFDGLWCIGVLHHLPDALVRNTIHEMFRACRRGGYTVIFDGVMPVSMGRRPLAWGIRKLDRGANFRDEVRFRQLLPPGHWTIERVTYAMTGLEGLFCVGLKS